MASAVEGDTVRIHYTGRLDDGTIFDTSEGREPLEFTVGSGQVISGFDSAVAGMEVNDEKTVTIPPEEAYGPRRDDLMLPMSRSHLPEELDPRVGQRLQMSSPEGRTFQVTVAEIHPDRLVLDANHPLAGQSLIFDLQLVSVA
ncbi:MAG: peptidylprolyl isomerase [Gemmatimonadota bacterium]|jgi:peptidylprolyl isomerase